MKYFLLKSGESPEIFLDTGNKNLIDDIIKELKNIKLTQKRRRFGYEKRLLFVMQF